MKLPVDPKPFRNRYLIMRHGESTANQQGLIVSAPKHGLESYGLTEKGHQQTIQSVQKQLQSAVIPTHIVSSDFKRAQETAKIAQQLFACSKPLTQSPHLRERFFGDLELTPNSNYPLVWDADRLDANHIPYQAESTEHVLQRMLGLMDQLENNFSGEVFLLVSHGDPLQILQADFQGIPVSQHRLVPHLETAEIRELKRSL